MGAIVTVILNGAKACALETNVGSIEEDKSADLIIVDGNPLTDVYILQQSERIRTVIKEGRMEVNQDI